MIIKSFTASSAAAALKMVRNTLGGEAVILKTRVIPKMESGRSVELVEITACIDEGVVSPGKIDEILKPTPQARRESRPVEKITRKTEEIPAEPERIEPAVEKSHALRAAEIINNDVRRSLNPEPKSDFDSTLQPFYLDLLDADVPAEYARQLIKAMNNANPAAIDLDLNAHRTVRDEFDGLTGPEPEYRKGMRVLFCGMSGSGKTSTLAKLAAELIARKKIKVKLASLDDIKISAYEEIGGYADILDIPIAASDSLTGRNSKDCLTLIDTPSVPHDNRARLDLLRKIRAVGPDIVFMVFSAVSRTRDLMDNLNLFESFSPTHLIASHLDETPRWGGLAAMARYLEVPLTYITDAPGGIGRLKKASAEELTRQILKVEEVIYE